jgi:hypothetical protein
MSKPQQNSYPFYIPKQTQQQHPLNFQGVNLDKSSKEAILNKQMNNNLYMPTLQIDSKHLGYPPNLGILNSTTFNNFSNKITPQYRKS